MILLKKYSFLLKIMLLNQQKRFQKKLNENMQIKKKSFCFFIMKITGYEKWLTTAIFLPSPDECSSTITTTLLMPPLITYAGVTLRSSHQDMFYKNRCSAKSCSVLRLFSVIKILNKKL